MFSDNHIPTKVGRVLNLILIGMLLILVRVWYLTVIQREEKLEQAIEPRRRSVIEHAPRGSIRDRFNIPLALNKMRYNAAVCYAQIRQIPSTKWVKDEQGKLVRKQARLDYITDLAKVLASTLEMDPIFIEDTIHGKASLFPHTPFVIKENISEAQYYRLRMLEKDWFGIQAERSYERIYPQGKTACDIVGYMGAISQKEYHQIAEEMQELQVYLTEREEGGFPFLPKGFNSPAEVRQRLKELQEKAYTINDLVGKTGIEKAFDESMRGFYGKKTHEVDTKGNFLRELPGSRKAVSGQRLVLTISSELQHYAESLLAQYESTRERPPWIKGGAIVAMVPQTGEVLALASHPRFDPNDFIPSRDPARKSPKSAAVIRWLENEAYIGEIWDGKRYLEKECFSHTHQTFYEEKTFLTWERYLDFVLAPKSKTRASMDRITTVRDAVHFQQQPGNEGLVLDLCRLVASEDRFSEELLRAIGTQALSDYRALNQLFVKHQSLARLEIQELFHDIDFSIWRKAHFKEFLREKRKEEKANKRYTRPYTDYLDAVGKKMFQEFWDEHRFSLLETFILGKIPPSMSPQDKLYPYLSHLIHRHVDFPALEKLQTALSSLPPSLSTDYLKSMRSFEELSRPLLGKYRSLRQHEGEQLEKHLAAAFYPLSGYGYGRSQAFRQSTPQGSVFKLVTAYTALIEKYKKQLNDLNPLTLVDDIQWTSKPGSNSQVLGYTQEGQAITRLYKNGRLPRTSHAHIGRVDLLGAIEQSSNIYFSILASEHIQQPNDLATCARLFGFGERTGIDLPGEIAGKIPDDLAHNLTGLYAFAIGQHSLVVTPLQTAVMVSSLVNEGNVLKPNIVRVVAGKEPARDEEIFEPRTPFPFQEHLSLVGISFPLFSQAEKKSEIPYVSYTQPSAKRTAFLPEQIRDLLLEGMRRVVSGPKGLARPSVIRDLYEDPKSLRDYYNLQNQLIGKTGTAEILYKPSIDPDTPATLHKHVWFAGVSFPSPVTKEHVPEPELVVIVYLRFGESGKEAAPLAAQIVKKWREIQKEKLAPSP
jgi:cell division protein FtsI/penicillin-binding protein 2